MADRPNPDPFKCISIDWGLIPTEPSGPGPKFGSPKKSVNSVSPSSSESDAVPPVLDDSTDCLVPKYF